MFFVVAAFVLGFFVKLLWNALIPDLFHGPELTYLQAVGLLVLTRLLAGFRAPRPFLWHLKKWGPPWTWRKRGWSLKQAMHEPYVREHYMCGEEGNDTGRASPGKGRMAGQ